MYLPNLEMEFLCPTEAGTLAFCVYRREMSVAVLDCSAYRGVCKESFWLPQLPELRPRLFPLPSPQSKSPP